MFAGVIVKVSELSGLIKLNEVLESVKFVAALTITNDKIIASKNHHNKGNDGDNDNGVVN